MTDLLAYQLLGRSLQTWGIAVGTALVLWAVLVLVRRVVASRLGALSQRTTNRIDDLVVALVRSIRGLVLGVVSVWPALQILDASDRVLGVAHVVTVVALVLQAMIWGNVLIAYVLEARVKELRSEDPASATTLGGVTVLARLVLWTVLVLVALDNLGVNISTLVAGLGIGGVAIALATQNVLGDLFASLSIALDKPFVVGDFIVVGDMAGSIENVGLKTTRVRSLSGEQLVFSNADLLNSRIRNYKRMMERRIPFRIGVTYETAQDQLAAIPGIVKSIIEADEQARFDRAHFLSFDDFALTFEIVYYVRSPDYNTYMDVQQRINLALFRQFAERGIDFAYPTRTLYLRQDSGDAAGSAA